MPPLNWTVGIMGEDFAFHHCSFDNRKYHPEWGDLFPGISDGNNCLWGYIRDGGETHGVLAVDQQATFAADGIAPVAVRLALTGTNGKTYRIDGRAISSTRIMAWPNMAANFILFEWDYEGRKGYGDTQVVIYRDAYRLIHRPR